MGHYTDSDFHPGWVNDDAVDDRAEELLSVGAGERMPRQLRSM